MPATRDPLFRKLLRGNVRDQILQAFRVSLRELNDPKTGVPWDETKIRRATMKGSRFWVEAESDDVIASGIQRRAEFMAQQVDPRRANTAFLENFHAPSIDTSRLPAFGGSGDVTVQGTPGTVFVGSSVIPDTLATVGTDPNGLRYQVLFDETIPASGIALVTIQGIDTGPETNIPEGTVITWSNAPPGSDPRATVFEDFSGGVPRETDQDMGQRIFSFRATRPRSGNPAHFRDWSRRSTNAVADAFVYPLALNTGSVMVAPIQKRSSVIGPTARIPSPGTMTAVIGKIVPPASSVVPGQVLVVAVESVAEPSNVIVSLPLRRGSAAGWEDVFPWPVYNAAPGVVVSSPSPPTQSAFYMSSDTAPPAVGVPLMMIWNPLTSAFEKLVVASVSSTPPYLVTLAAPHSGRTITAGDWISPFSRRAVSISAGVGSFFDSLGPGEICDLATDVRAARAFRRPDPQREWSYIIDGAIVDYIAESLGTQFFGGSLISASKTTPTVPTSASLGPNLLVAGKLAVYAP